MYDNLKNTIIDITDLAYKDFPEFLNGSLFIEYNNGFVTQEIPKPPQSITMRQTRLQLLEDGLLDEVELLVSSDKKSQIEWEYASSVERQSPLIELIGVQLKLTDEQLDTMFIKASKL